MCPQDFYQIISICSISFKTFSRPIFQAFKPENSHTFAIANGLSKQVELYLARYQLVLVSIAKKVYQDILREYVYVRPPAKVVFNEVFLTNSLAIAIIFWLPKLRPKELSSQELSLVIDKKNKYYQLGRASAVGC